MCGIAGLFKYETREKSNDILDRMLKSLYHRGPDDEGRFSSEHFTAGMRRLSINDVQEGGQPLYNENRSVILFYNGEIYNSPALRKELAQKGVIFRTKSDGEVIVHLYELYRESAFEKLDGMFAIALWDTRSETLTLARDSPGEKPLFYWSDGGNKLVYASEVNAIKQISRLNTSLNRQAIWDYPTFLWIPDPLTAHEDILSLPRGHFLTAERGKVNIRPFKNSSSFSFDLKNDDELIGTVRNTVEEAVNSRLLSEVPMGSFLSGGLDSSIVSTIASQKLSQLDTFTVSFEDVEDPYHGRADESEAAAHTASIIGSRHHSIKVNAEVFRKSLDQFCRYSDLPFGVSSGLGIMAVSAAAKESGIKVLLSGDGADETFGGYSWYPYLSRLTSNKSDLPSRPVSFQNFGLSLEQRLSYLSQMNSEERAWAWHYYAHEKEKKMLFSKDFQEGLASSLRHFDNLKDSYEPEDYIRHDRNFYFPYEMLRKVDRLGMANSVEGRTPFAAPSVLALADNLRYDQMIRGKDLKWALRRAFENILPMEIINRPKHGFNVPIDLWLKSAWSDLVEETFSEDSELQRQNIISRESLAIVHGMLADKNRLNGHTIFCFIMLNKWLSL